MNLEKLNEFIDLFIKYMNNLEKDNEKDREERKKYYQSFDYNKILEMSEEELTDYIKKLWCVLPISIKNIINKNGFDNFKTRLANLLYGSGNIADRYDEFYTNIDHFKASAISEILTYNYPNDFIIWDNKVRTVFEWIGLSNLPSSADNMNYTEYSRMIEYGKRIRDIISSKLNKIIDLLDADYFYHVVYVLINQNLKANSINLEKFNELLNDYKKDFSNYRNEEIYKWEAILEFNKNWNLEYPDFTSMLKRSLSKSANLLTSNNYYPLLMITRYSEREPETVRGMFRELYDENIDIISRVVNFQKKSDELLNKYNEDGKNSYQDLHTISVYLTFKYPDKYYIYKPTIAKKAYKLLCSDFSSKNRGVELYSYFIFANALRNTIINDEEILQMSKDSLNEECYPDSNYSILVSDFIYYCGSKEMNEDNNWIPADYSPGITVEKWIEILNDQQITSKNVLKVLKRFKDIGEKATCKELSVKYGESPGFYNIVSSKYGHKVYDYTNCRLVESDDDNLNWWPILYVGRYATKEEDGAFVWKLRGELSEALERIDLSMINLYEKKGNEWIIPANHSDYNHVGAFNKNGFIDWSQYVNYDVGDIVYIYLSEPEKRIFAVSEVEKINLSLNEKENDEEFVLSDDMDVKRKELNRFVRLRLIKYVNDERLNYYDLLKHGLNGPIQRAIIVYEELSKYINYVLNGGVVFNSMNIIYYGGPGCGKSKLVEQEYCQSDNFIRTTFYPDYTNSDFVGQLVPKYDKSEEKLKYEINPGPFTRALEMAYNNPNRNIYLIIEEINRGNAAAIFGDIFQLLDRVTKLTENDKKIKTIGESEYEISNNIIENYIYDKYGRDISGKVKIPVNMSIIATMNTSDQNVYTLDSAFKRRWKMKHITNEFTDKEYDQIIGNKYVPMKGLNIKWKDFVEQINDSIVKINTFGINSEDKQIGKYFVSTSDLLDSEIIVEEYDDYKPAVRAFAEKVLMYLWEDIAKLKPSEWFNDSIETLDELLKQYESNGIDVFSYNIQTKLKDGKNVS